MGHGRWTKVLRVVLSFIIVLLIMLATAQKAY